MKIDRVDDACWGGYAQERIEANEAVKAAVRIFKERGVRNIIDIGCGGGRDRLTRSDAHVGGECYVVGCYAVDYAGEHGASR